MKRTAKKAPRAATPRTKSGRATKTRRAKKTPSLIVKGRKPDLTDRMTARERPEGPPLVHQQWDQLLFAHWLRDVATSNIRSTMLGAAGIPTPDAEPRLVAAGPVEVEIWPLEELGDF